MRKLIIGLSILLAALVAAAFILPGLIPASVYKDKITEQVSNALGREVTIAGEVKLSILPTITAKANTVQIANDDGFSDQAFATMDSLQAKVKLWPLFKKQVEITEFKLVNPTISLEKTKDGRVNWVFGVEQAEPLKKPETGFARDGRYTDLEIALGVFSLDNGTVNYSDAFSGTQYNLRAVNMKLTMPGLDKPVTAKGDLVVNDTALDIEFSLDTPKSFLNGKAAPVLFKLKSSLGNLTAKGAFTPSQLLTFDVDIDANIPSTSKLDGFFNQNNPYGALTETASLKGNLVFDGQNMIGKGTQISLKSDIINTRFSGDFTAGMVPSATGDLTIDIANLPDLQTALGMAIPQLTAFDTANLTTSLSSDGKVTTAKNLTIDVKGDIITANYVGAAVFDTALSLAGRFKANSPSIPALLPKLGMVNLQGAQILGDLSLSSRVNGVVDALVFEDFDFKTKGEHLTASYIGKIETGKTTRLNGSFVISAPALKSLTNTGGFALPYSGALGALKASGSIDGRLDALNISGLKAALTDGLLNLTLDGNMTTGNKGGYTGLVNLDIASVRQLADLSGAKLPPNTDVGQVYGPLNISGQAVASLSQIEFTNAKIGFDALSGTGNFRANLSGKPNLKGVLDMPGLDIRPYQASIYANRPKGLQPWSEAPLNLTFLKLFDANFTLNTPNILTNAVELGQSTIKTSVKNGQLKTSIPNVSLYGGQGQLDMSLNATTSVPQVALDFTLNNVDGQGLLGAIAGFTKLTGNTGTTMRIQGSGNSQAEIMRSLRGDGNFELAEGMVSGVDLEQFISNLGSLNTLLQSPSLPAGIGPAYSTPFNKLNGLFSIKNGVVTVGDFALTANGLLAEGAGTLDIGRQKVDFSLRPRLKDGNGQFKKGLAGFGIPIKLSGDFGGIRAGLDTDLVGKIIAARAKADIQNRITDQLGGELGGVIGGLLGNPQTPQPTDTPQPNGPQPAQQTTPKPTDPLSDLLGGLLGSPETPAPESSSGSSPESPNDPKNAETNPEGENSENTNSENTGTEGTGTEGTGTEGTGDKKKDFDPLEKALLDLLGGD